MRRSTSWASRLAVLCIAGLLAAGCAGSPAGGPAPTVKADSPAHSQTPSASPASDSPVSPFKSLLSLLGRRQGTITAAVYDRRTNRLWVYRPGVREYTASIVKVEILGTALAQAQARNEPLPTAEAALAVPMIEASDNTSATDLLADVGGAPAVLRFDDSAGLTSTSPSALAVIPGTDWPGWGLTTTTARDQVMLVRRFAFPNPVLTDASRSYGLNLMEHVADGQNWGVSAGVAPGATIALKNGWIPYFPQPLRYDSTGALVNSIGWIHGHGRDYVIAVLTSNDPSEGYGIDTTELISRQIYDELGS